MSDKKKVKYVPPDWTLQVNDDGAVVGVLYRSQKVDRVASATLRQHATTPILPELHLTIMGPVSVERVQGAILRETEDGEEITTSPDLILIND